MKFLKLMHRVASEEIGYGLSVNRNGYTRVSVNLAIAFLIVFYFLSFTFWVGLTIAGFILHWLVGTLIILVPLIIGLIIAFLSVLDNDERYKSNKRLIHTSQL